ncbi:YeiH family protein [Fretibacterium sp. OH1220_COT-178]|uniref:YeiH family protein n=1 Tax=Fretibacterium sp. OH1220_COT-178 TaxID=2491047 RepID=UPI000F5D8659|nr:YeiH family protein [Fretibacterium sp. OH1220_COT-178]RRD66108.1 YeiH family putative sulfate export transporter [Fretibacterium sp. OH1220_COT-178]
MNKWKNFVPGLFLSIAIAALAWFCGRRLPVVGAPVFGILFGMLVALCGSFPVLKEGTRFASKRLLQLSVILLGFEMNMRNVLAVGSESLMVMAFTLTAAFLSAWAMQRVLRLDSVTATLIGVGTAICGGSAIAATAPVIDAKDKDIAHSISTIFLFNIVAVFAFPAFGHLLQMSDQGFGIWAGTAVNDTSSVLAAGYAYSDAAGKLATIVKLTRTLMIIPITFGLSLYVARTRKGTANFSLAKAFPWFVLGFVAASLLHTAGIVSPDISRALTLSGKFLIVAAMAAIGLNTHLGKLLANGLKPILMGLVCWISLAATSLIVQHFLRLL